MVESSNLRSQDYNDIVHDLTMALIKAEEKYDPSKGSPETFANVVIENTKNNIFRYRIKRGLDKSIFINNPPENFSKAEATFKQWNLTMEVQEVISTLSPMLQEVCRLLMNEHTLVEISTILSIPYTTLQRNVQRTIRTAFIKAGFFSNLKD